MNRTAWVTFGVGVIVGAIGGVVVVSPRRGGPAPPPEPAVNLSLGDPALDVRTDSRKGQVFEKDGWGILDWNKMRVSWRPIAAGDGYKTTVGVLRPIAKFLVLEARVENRGGKKTREFDFDRYFLRWKNATYRPAHVIGADRSITNGRVVIGPHCSETAYVLFDVLHSAKSTDVWYADSKLGVSVVQWRK